MQFINKIRAKLGDIWWYSLLMFVALRTGDVINAFVGLWLVPKYVAPEELGAVLPLVNFASSIGLPITVLTITLSKYLAKFKSLGQDGEAKSLLKISVVTTILLVAGTSTLGLFILPHFLERLRIPAGSLGILIITCGILSATSPVFSRALQGLKKFNAITISNILSAPLRLVTMLIAMPFRALSGYMLGQAIAPLFTIGWASWCLRKELNTHVKSKPFWAESGKSIIRFAAFIFIWQGFGAILSPVQSMIIRQRLPEMESAAFYMISRFAELATYAGVTLTFVVFPFAAEAHAKKQSSIALLVKSNLIIFFFGLLCSIGLYIVGPFVFRAIPTCRPYIAYTPEMAYYALYLTLTQITASLTYHEIANEHFRWLVYTELIAVLTTTFLVCFTGYTTFYGTLPDSIVKWMGNLHIATLHNFLTTCYIGILLSIFCLATDIYLRRQRELEQ